MEIYLKNWYKKLIAEISKTKNLKIISPFVKEQVLRKIEGLYNLSNFELITRFNLQDFALGVSSLSGLKFSVEKGANVYGIKGLHSKVYIFDKRAAIITSANLTSGGLTNNFECGIFITDRATIENLLEYFNDLKGDAINKLTVADCDIWADKLNGINTPSGKIKSLPDYGASVPIIDKKRNYYIKFLGSASDRVDLGFPVKEEIDRALCHYACGFPFNKKPQQVKDGDVIFMARLTKNPNDYAIFGKAIALKYTEGRDEATEKEKEERIWKKKWPIYLRVKEPVFIDGTMTDCVLMKDLLAKFDYDSFYSTRLRFDNGEVDIKPTKSLMQKAYIKLTLNSAEWLEQKFRDAIDNIGQVDSTFLESLPQSIINIDNAE